MGVYFRRQGDDQLRPKSSRIEWTPTHYSHVLSPKRSSQFSQIHVHSPSPLLCSINDSPRNHREELGRRRWNIKGLGEINGEEQELSVLFYPEFPSRYRSHKTGRNNSSCQFISSVNGSSRGLIFVIFERIFHISLGGKYTICFKGLCRK